MVYNRKGDKTSVQCTENEGLTKDPPRLSVSSWKLGSSEKGPQSFLFGFNIYTKTKGTRRVPLGMSRNPYRMKDLKEIQKFIKFVGFRREPVHTT